MTALTTLLQDPAYWAAVLTLSTPLIFSVNGALLCARAGELNLGIEGIFFLGALTCLFVAQHGFGPWHALLWAAGIGMVAGLLQGIITGRLGLSQTLVGLAFTILGVSVAQALWPAAAVPTAQFAPVDVSSLPTLPYIGEILSQQTPLLYLAVPFAVVLAYVLNRTPLGLAIRACGENPVAVAVKGRSVHGLRIGAAMVGSAAIAAGGAAIALSTPATIPIDDISGRGFIALAVAAAAGWRPGVAFAGALLFGAIYAATPNLQQAYGVREPLMATIPYMLAIFALAAMRRRLRWPAALAVPFFMGRSN
jgi:general nucleoside transport system permease protein